MADLSQLLAHRVNSPQRINSGTIGGIADMPRSPRRILAPLLSFPAKPVLIVRQLSRPGRKRLKPSRSLAYCRALPCLGSLSEDCAALRVGDIIEQASLGLVAPTTTGITVGNDILGPCETGQDDGAECREPAGSRRPRVRVDDRREMVCRVRAEDLHGILAAAALPDTDRGGCGECCAGRAAGCSAHMD
jgi:hypothetical protein